MINLTDEQIKKIEKFALDFYSKKDFLHNESHAHRSVKIAEFIAKKEGMDVELAKLGALLHQFHDHENRLINFLKKLKIPKSEIEKIVHFAKFRPHRGPIKPMFPEVKAVYDADIIQALGTFGTLRIFAQGIKRFEDMNKAFEYVRKTKKKFFKNLQTKTAKQLMKKPQKLAGEFLKLYDKEDKGIY